MTPDQKSQLKAHFRDKIREFSLGMQVELTDAEVEEILQNVLNRIVQPSGAVSPFVRSAAGVILHR